MYPNEEIISKDKICLNINVNKSSIDDINNKNKVNHGSHLVNFFSLFCGGEKDDNDELPNFLKNNIKDNILNDKELINDPAKAIKDGLIKCELDYIKKFIDDKIEEQKNSEVIIYSI